jgi:hypothetical protein
MKLQSVLFLLLFSFISNGVSAQTQYGLKAGFNLANQNVTLNLPGTPSQNLDSKLLAGYEIGAFIKSRLTSKFKLATELNYSTNGSKVKYSATPYVNPDGSIAFLNNAGIIVRNLTN